MKLYEMGAQYRDIARRIEDAEEAGDANALEALLMAFEEVDEDIDAKLVSIAKLIESYRAEARAIKEVADKQAKRAKQADSRADWLAGYAMRTMKATGHENIVSPELTMRIKVGTGSVDIDDEAQVPDEFWVEVPATRTLDKAALRNALLARKKVIEAINKAGEALPPFKPMGAHLVFSEKLEVK